ncbi:hypothetical protein BDR04DRAFT_1157714 [Suillus decipiens]|nr:hypothetical protein BDR04DRAFT_1157714 [Suillus decipiens]
MSERSGNVLMDAVIPPQGSIVRRTRSSPLLSDTEIDESGDSRQKRMRLWDDSDYLGGTTVFLAPEGSGGYTDGENVLPGLSGRVMEDHAHEHHPYIKEQHQLTQKIEKVINQNKPAVSAGTVGTPVALKLTD